MPVLFYYFLRFLFISLLLLLFSFFNILASVSLVFTHTRRYKSPLLYYFNLSLAFFPPFHSSLLFCFLHIPFLSSMPFHTHFQIYHALTLIILSLILACLPSFYASTFYIFRFLFFTSSPLLFAFFQHPRFSSSPFYTHSRI